MTYHTLSAPAQATYDIKKSQFLAFAYSIDGRDTLMFHVEQLRQRYPDAHHVCYGYIIGDPNNTTSAGFDDDGEPTGTAGRPILNVLQHKAIGNACILVVRYFGGIKLGAGGLVRAYAAAAQAAIEKAVLQRVVPMTQVVVETDFAYEAMIRRLLGVEASVSYGTQVVLTATIKQSDVASFKEAVGHKAKIYLSDKA